MPRSPKNPSARRLAVRTRTFVAAATVLVIAGVAAPVAAAQTPDPPGPEGHPHPPALAAAQRACLTQHGVTLPSPPSGGQPPVAPTDAQRQAFRAAAQACGLPAMRPGGPRRLALTAAQRDCLTQHGVTLPPLNGVHPLTPPSAAQRQAFEAAATACGLPHPSRRL